MNIGTLWAQIGLDNSQLKSSVKESEQTISNMSSSVANSIKGIETQAMSWHEFLKGRMGPAMKEAMAAGASHADAHRIAMGNLSQAYKEYKATGVTAVKDVTSATKEATSVTQSLTSSFGSLKSTVVTVAAAFGVGLGLHKIIQEVREAIQAIDSLKIATIQIAAQITTLQGPKDVAQHYADATKYADGLNRKLMEIDANTFANFRTLQNMTQVMTMHGVILDYNNKKQVDSFTALSNAVAMYTAGQNQEIQSRQEINALLTGHLNMNSRLAQQMDGLIKAEGIYKDGLDEVVKLGKQHGDLLERFTPYLVGINAAAGDIAHTWEAVISSAQTAKFMIQSVGFRGLYEDAIAFGGRFVGYLKEHAELIGSGIYRAWLSVRGVVESIYLLFQQQDGALRGWTYVIQSIGAGVNAILEGWAFLLSTILPTLIEKFNGVISILNAMVNMGYMFGKILFDGILEAIKSVGYLSEAFSRLIVGDFAGAGAALKKAFGTDFKATMDDNLVVVKGTVAAIKEEYAKLKDTGSFNKRFDAFMARPSQAGAPPVPTIPTAPDQDAIEQRKNFIDRMNLEATKSEHKGMDDALALALEYNDKMTEAAEYGEEAKLAVKRWYQAEATLLDSKQAEESIKQAEKATEESMKVYKDSLNAKLEAEKSARENQSIAGEAVRGYDSQLSALESAQGTKEQFREMDIIRTQEVQNQISSIEAAAARERIINDAQTNKLRVRAAQDSAAAMVNILQALFIASGSKSRELFEMMKVARIAQATVDTYAAATRALADVPYPYNMAAAAAIVAGGLANVATIASTTIGGSSGGGGGGGTSIQTQDVGYKYFNYEQSEYGSGWRAGEGQGPGTVINVNGDVYAQDGDAFKAKVVGAWVDDYKDNGNTRSVAKRYA